MLSSWLLALTTLLVLFCHDVTHAAQSTGHVTHAAAQSGHVTHAAAHSPTAGHVTKAAASSSAQAGVRQQHYPAASHVTSHSAAPVSSSCPVDQLKSCPQHSSTCCQAPNKQFICCPYPNAVCCPGSLFCCPQGFTCNVKGNTCVRPATAAAIVKLTPLIAHSQSSSTKSQPAKPIVKPIQQTVVKSVPDKKRDEEEKQGFVSGVISAVRSKFFSSNEKPVVNKPDVASQVSKQVQHKGGVQQQHKGGVQPQHANVKQNVPAQHGKPSSSVAAQTVKPVSKSATVAAAASAGANQQKKLPVQTTAANKLKTPAVQGQQLSKQQQQLNIPGGQKQASAAAAHTVNKQQSSNAASHTAGKPQLQQQAKKSIPTQNLAGKVNSNQHQSKATPNIQSTQKTLASQVKDNDASGKGTGFFSSVLSAVTDKFYTKDKKTDASVNIKKSSGVASNAQQKPNEKLSQKSASAAKPVANVVAAAAKAKQQAQQAKTQQLQKAGGDSRTSSANKPPVVKQQQHPPQQHGTSKHPPPPPVPVLSKHFNHPPVHAQIKTKIIPTKPSIKPPINAPNKPIKSNVIQKLPIKTVVNSAAQKVLRPQGTVSTPPSKPNVVVKKVPNKKA